MIINCFLLLQIQASWFIYTVFLKQNVALERTILDRMVRFQVPFSLEVEVKKMKTFYFLTKKFSFVKQKFD